MNRLFYSLFLLLLPLLCLAKEPVRIHSHNDYHQQVPFYQAYSQQVYAIEADIYTGETLGSLLVAHDPEELSEALSLDRMYLEPLVFLFDRNEGRPWDRSGKTITLMIDLKTPLHPTIDFLIAKLRKHPRVFDPQANPYAVRIVISGSRPDPIHFGEYPSFIAFDGFIDADYTPEQLERIAFISANLSGVTPTGRERGNSPKPTGL